MVSESLRRSPKFEKVFLHQKVASWLLEYKTAQLPIFGPPLNSGIYASPYLHCPGSL
jgi:hypothetical protein